jgi:hypothetical protein
MHGAFSRIPEPVRRAYFLDPGVEPPKYYTARRTVVKELLEVTQKKVDYITHDPVEFEVLESFSEIAEAFPSGGGKLTLGPIPDEHLYWMCLTLADDIQARRNFEYYIWRMFRRNWKGYEKWRNTVVAKIVSTCLRGMSGSNQSGVLETEVTKLEEEAKKTVDENSLAFVSATRIPPTIGDIVLRHKSKEGPIRLYNEKRGIREAPQPYEKHGAPSYHVIVCVPSSLDETALDVLYSTWDQAVEQWQWFYPSAE